MRLRLLLAGLLVGLTLPATPALADDPKIEQGLGTGPVRVIVEVTDSAAVAPVAAESTAEVLVQAPVSDPAPSVTPSAAPSATPSGTVLPSPSPTQSPTAAPAPVVEPKPFLVVEGTPEQLAELAEDPRVTGIRRDRAFPPAALNTLPQIGADKAHAAGFTGAGQAIAILDTGIDRDHPAFAGKIVGEACFSAADDTARSLCPNGQTTQTGEGAADAETALCASLCDHGSHVAGIASGVAPGASLVAVQIFSRHDSPDVCGDEGPCVLAYESSLLQAIDYLTTAQVPVPLAAVNLSLGGQPYESACDDAVFKPKFDALLAKGIAPVVAAGNESFEGVTFPGCISSAVTVGATDATDGVAFFSNRGPLLDLLAPGVDVESAVPDDLTAVHSGTSMSAPHVAGTLAVLKARTPGASVDSLVDALKRTGLPVTYPFGDSTASTPRIDLNGAITGVPPTPSPSGPTPTPVPDDSPSGDEDPNDGTGDGTDGTDDPTDENPTDEPTDEQTTTPPPATVVPLPAITVTVTVTVTPTPGPAAAPVCTRGTAGARLSAAQWATEIHRSTGTIADATLVCYLKLVGKASRVFPELTKASTLGTAYKVLKKGKDRALLTAWLNWAHGKNGTTALRKAEKTRLSA
ncbi:S8 family peptidase [Nonomuraea sp. NPDC050328]|uniref:S8 family peptidase n=1 Tax=Nonomuraea sp. NPDC050328 TaxID=3364361 RepID=UPI003799FDA2